MMRYVIASYVPPAEPVKAGLSAAERSAVVAIVRAALATPKTFEEVLNIIHADPTLTAATKNKCDGERVQEALDRAVEAGNLKRIE